MQWSSEQDERVLKWIGSNRVELLGGPGALKIRGQSRVLVVAVYQRLGRDQNQKRLPPSNSSCIGS